jgi:hypothetical protein
MGGANNTVIVQLAWHNFRQVPPIWALVVVLALQYPHIASEQMKCAADSSIDALAYFQQFGE